MVDAQPVNVLVTTHWYVPPNLTVPVVVAAPAIAPGPVHAYDTGVIVVDALTCDVKLVQVIEPVFDELTTGIPTLGITETVPEFIQPFVGLVTVNVQVLGEQADAVNEVDPEQTPPDQRAVQVEGPAEPIKETVGDAQVIV